MSPISPPMITDELPSDTLASGGGEHTDALVGEAMFDFFGCAKQQDLVIALFVQDNPAPLYGRVHAIKEHCLILELLDQMDVSDVLPDSRIQGVARTAGKRLKFDACFAGYEESDTVATMIRLSMPTQCMIVQRRNAYRLNLLPLTSVSCFASAHGDEIEISVVDISLGGIGLLGVAPGLALTAGTRLVGVRLELSPGNCLIVDLEVCSQADYFLKNGIKTVRTGTRFVHISPRDTQALTQFINRLSAQRRTD